MNSERISGGGYKTYANQTPNGDNFVRSAFRDKLLADMLDGSADFAIDTYAPLAYDMTAEGRKRFAIRPFSTTLTRDIAASAATLYLASAPAIGAALAIGSRVRIVLTVTEITPGVEYQVLTDVGASSGNYPASTTGTIVNECYVSDGQVETNGLHISKIANDNIAAAAGDYSFTALKTALKTAVGGTWA